MQTTISNLLKMAERSQKWVENTVGKGEMLVTSNFSFSHSVFKIPVLQTRKTTSLVWERVTFKSNFITYLVKATQSEFALHPYQAKIELRKQFRVFSKFGPFYIRT